MGSKADMPRGLLNFLIIRLKAKLMLYVVFFPCCASPMLGSSHVMWDESITLGFTLVALILAESVGSFSVIVMLLSRNMSSLSHSRPIVWRTCCCRAILHCRRCSLGLNMMVMSSVLCEMRLALK